MQLRFLLVIEAGRSRLSLLGESIFRARRPVHHGIDAGRMVDSIRSDKIYWKWTALTEEMVYWDHKNLMTDERLGCAQRC